MIVGLIFVLLAVIVFLVWLSLRDDKPNKVAQSVAAGILKDVSVKKLSIAQLEIDAEAKARKLSNKELEDEINQ